MALAGGAAVAGAALRVAAGIGWLGIGATRPEHRRRGGQSALLAARIEAGLAHGVAGFRIAYDRRNWAL